jgi:hypothetical protein
MKKFILLALLCVGCSIKKITYKVTRNDSEWIEVEYVRTSCWGLTSKHIRSNIWKYEILSCEEDE